MIALTVPTSWLRALDLHRMLLEELEPAAHVAMPCVDVDDVVGERVDVGRVVGDQQRSAGRGAPAARRSSARRRLRKGSSSAANGSSSSSARGSAGQRAGQRDALALAARELVGVARRRAARSSSASSQRSTAARASLAARIAPAAAQAEGDVLAHRQVREQRVLLEQVAAAGARRAGMSMPRCAVEQRLAGQRDRGRRRAASRPAIACRVRLLPAPDGPNSTSRVASLRNATSSSKRCAPLLDGLADRDVPTLHRHAARDARRARSRPGEQQHGDAGRSRSSAPGRWRASSWPGLHRLVDGDRERLRLAGDAAGHHQRRAELAERAREREQHAGEDAAPGQRQRDAKEHRRPRRARAPARPPRAARRPFSNAARADLQTNGKATIAAAITAPCQVKIRWMPKLRSSQRAEPAAPADEHQQVVAEHGRRQHHRQEQDRVDAARGRGSASAPARSRRRRRAPGRSRSPRARP